jgi:hypothetical protein
LKEAERKIFIILFGEVVYNKEYFAAEEYRAKLEIAWRKTE